VHKGELCAKALARIKASELWGPRSRESGDRLSGLVCPECGKDAWAYRDGPFVIICNHKNSCEARVLTLDLFPDLKENIEKEYPPTREDRNRPAREYLYSRGISAKTLEGVRFVYRPNVRKSGAGGVLFFVGVNADGQEVWNGRIFNPPPDVDKSHNQGKTEGMLWWHPRRKYDPEKPTHVVEGIIEALSMDEMDVQAVTPLTSGADPDKCDLGLVVPGLEHNLVIALNPDNAGGKGLRKWKKRYPGAKAIAPVKGDWNDLLRNAGGGIAAREAFDRALPEMTCRANLLLAEKAEEYAEIWFEYYGRPPGLFAFGRRYYWGVVGKKQMEVRSVSDFILETDHFEQDTSSADNSVYRYFVKVSPANGRSRLCSMGGADLSSPNAIRSALLTNACVLWKGDQGPSLALGSKILKSRAPMVRQIHVIGHDRESGALVFHEFAIDREGKIHSPDQKGFFRLSGREILRPALVESDRDRTLKPKKGVGLKQIYDLVNQAWPDNGPLALSFWLMTWFVWCVKSELGFFPFLSLWGDTQTGKSGLARRLNAMQCWDSEGLPMTKVNTSKGEVRELARKSGMCIPLLEGNNPEKMRMEMNNILTWFNAGNPLQVRAKKTNDLATKVIELQASICFVQNREPFETKAQMERVVSSRKFRSNDITSSSSSAFSELWAVPARELAQCYVEVMKLRRWVEDGWYAEYIKARTEILEKVPDNRIAETHGLVLAFHRYAEKIFGAKNDLTAFFIRLAEWKHRKCNHRESTEAESFFEAIDGVGPKTRAEFLDIADGKVYVQLPLALSRLGGVGYGFYRAQLMEPLREHPAFLASNVGHRAFWDYTTGPGATKELKKCWVFDGAKLDEEMYGRLTD